MAGRITLSLSARRAWIEIFCQRYPFGYFGVALRKESVDRNITALAVLSMYSWSLSARRAWIEMDWASVITAMTSVALRKESVDRNFVSAFDVLAISVALRKESVDRNDLPG